MSNPIIKFDHDFYKIRGQTKARLLDVEVVTRNELDPDMVALDVQYYVNVPLEQDPEQTQPECRQAKLPNGHLTVLYFKGDKRIPFTEIRKCLEKKIMKYRQQAYEKQVFDIVVNEK